MKNLVFLFLLFYSFYSPAQEKLLVFAGAGMKRTLEEIATSFERDSGIKITFDFEGAGRLGNKILLGNTPDIFIPGSEKWANILINKKIINDYQKIAFHTPVIITRRSEKLKKLIKQISDLCTKEITIAIGDKQACAIGKISEKIFKKAGIEINRLNIVSKGVTVNQLLLWVENGDVDASIVWQSDANTSEKVRIITLPEKYNSIAVIPVCYIKHSKAADKFMEFMSKTGKEIFKRSGFRIIK